MYVWQSMWVSTGIVTISLSLSFCPITDRFIFPQLLSKEGKENPIEISKSSPSCFICELHLHNNNVNQKGHVNNNLIPTLCPQGEQPIWIPLPNVYYLPSRHRLMRWACIPSSVKSTFTLKPEKRKTTKPRTEKPPATKPVSMKDDGESLSKEVINST